MTKTMSSNWRVGISRAILFTGNYRKWLGDWESSNRYPLQRMPILYCEPGFSLGFVAGPVNWGQDQSDHKIVQTKI